MNMKMVLTEGGMQRLNGTEPIEPIPPVRTVAPAQWQ